MVDPEGFMDVVVLELCKGLICSLVGGRELEAWCAAMRQAGFPLELSVMECSDNCSQAPLLRVNGKLQSEANPSALTMQMIAENWFV
jgi:NADH:ubiquinone oxidoreductase subunit E